MRGLLIATVFCGMLPAQHVSIHAGAGRSMGMFGNSHLPPLAPIPPLGGGVGFGQFPRFGHGRGLGGFAFGYPWYFGGGYDGGYESASPNVVIVMPQTGAAAPEPPAPPPEKPRPEIHEYSHPDANSNAPAAFSIIAKDGSSHSAAAVWVQGDVVRYVTADGGGGQLPLASIDRAATQKANAEKHLTLSLPPANEPG